MLVQHDNVILLLTATIDPRDCSAVTRRDPAVRLNDYTNALVKWLREPQIPKILFCENSGSQLDQLIGTVNDHNRFGKDVHFISYDARGYGHRGKGYGEIGIISRALSEWSVNDRSMIITVSGRYYIRNIDAILSDLFQTDTDVMSGPFILPYSVLADCYISTPRFLRDFLCRRQEEVDDSTGNFFERILAFAIKDAVDAGLTHTVFMKSPDIDGVSGAFGVPWKETWFASAAILHGDGSVEIRRREQLALFADVLRDDSGGAARQLLDKLTAALDCDSPARIDPVEVSLIVDRARLRVQRASKIVKFFEHCRDIPALTVDHS